MEEEERTESLIVRMTKTAKSKLVATATRRGITMSRLVRLAINEYIENHTVTTKTSSGEAILVSREEFDLAKSAEANDEKAAF